MQEVLIGMSSSLKRGGDVNIIELEELALRSRSGYYLAPNSMVFP